MIKPQNELALIVAYYLSRFDKRGYTIFGYKNFSDAITEMGAILDVKPRTIQGMRDEFDPYHQNDRVGWVRELKGSRQKVLKTFQNTDDETLIEVVKEILTNKEFSKTEEYKDIHALFSNAERTFKQEDIPVYMLRGATGKTAEALYLDHFKKHGLPVMGDLVDCRDFGCGYDFEIKDNGLVYYVEVKGMSLGDGGILFTNKEWQTALKQKEKYYLVVVKNISTVPELLIIQNPASKLTVNKNIYTTVQVSWSARGRDLK